MSQTKPNPDPDMAITYHKYEDVSRSLNLRVKETAVVFGISRATLDRRRTQGYFTTRESDRVRRVERLLGLAERTFGDHEQSLSWLKTPQWGLGGTAPLDHARTEAGAREVEELLGRIQYGVYS